MRYFPAISAVISDYDALLLDLWGCVHDGTNLYPGALDCMARAHEAGKKIVFLSNAPRRAARAQSVLDQLGVPRELYAALVTSGEVGFQALDVDGGRWMVDKKTCSSPTTNHQPPSTYYFLGAEYDRDVLAGLPCQPVAEMADAEFILNCGFGTEGQSNTDFHALMADAAARGLPMLCLNPDLEVVKLTGEHFPCAGLLAQEYARLGGHVTYFGKPYSAVYDHALQILGAPKHRVLAVGDSLHTDIAGARNHAVTSALVTGGILQATMGTLSPEQALAWLATQDVRPDYVLPGLVW
jgi:HAD superfamily hydrolase (TIGR01459 family)